MSKPVFILTELKPIFLSTESRPVFKSVSERILFIHNSFNPVFTISDTGIFVAIVSPPVLVSAILSDNFTLVLTFDKDLNESIVPDYIDFV